MSTAIIQGATGGLGLPLTRLLLKKTNLNLICLTSKSSSSPLPDDLDHSRIEVIHDVDLKREGTVQKAAGRVKDLTGGKGLRLVVCLAGQLHPEKSLAQLDPAQALEDMHLNSLGHLVLYKHLLPMIPTRRQFEKLGFGASLSSTSVSSSTSSSASTGTEGVTEDPARGWVRQDGAVLLSTSARVGSIGDNRKGGWYSYRASKAALNQMIRTLDHELMMKKSSALAMAYHPGTTLTSFTRPIIGNPQPDPAHGLFTPEQGALKLLEMIQRARRGHADDEDGGRGHGGGFYDWKGEAVDW